MTFYNHQNRKRGFTLIELLVVIAIIGLLSSMSVYAINIARMKARDAKRLADLKQIATALDLFYDQQSRYPASPGGTCWDLCAQTSHTQYFKNCLEQGINCGFTTTNFQSVMPNVPSNPLDDPNVNQGFNYHYFTGYEGRGPECYILGTLLETNHPALNNDADGDRRNLGDNGCADPYYCIKVNWPCN
jgi:prepilin-type N-terminal cleavage/methylation domain-containing protein